MTNTDRSIRSGTSALATTFVTLAGAILFGLVALFLAAYFDRSHADEPVVFGSLGGLLLVGLGVMAVYWLRHRQTLIATVQGAVLFACAAYPMFRQEPGAEGIIMTALAFVLGGGAAAGLVGILKSILRSRAVNRPVSVAIIGWILMVIPSAVFLITLCLAPELAIVGIIALALQIVLSVGILRGWNWSRWTYLVVAGIGLVLSLGDIGPGQLVGIPFYLVTVWILTRPSAKAFFHGKSEH